MRIFTPGLPLGRGPSFLYSWERRGPGSQNCVPHWRGDWGPGEKIEGAGSPVFPREQGGLNLWRLRGSSSETRGIERKGVLPRAPWGRAADRGFLDTPATGPTSGQTQGPPLPSRTFPRHVSPLLTSSVFRARAVTREGAGPREREGSCGSGGAGRESRLWHVTRPRTCVLGCPRLT